MKKLYSLLLVIAFLFPFSTAVAEAEKPLALYFFENYCDSCRPEEEFQAEFQSLTGDLLSNYTYRYANVKTEYGMSLYEQALRDYSISEDMQKLPMLIVNGMVYAGSSSIQEALPRAFVEQGETTDSFIYYLYSPACESCQNVKAAFAGLGGTTEVRRGDYRFESKVLIEEINIFDDLSSAEALFERYQVPEDKRITPIIFIGERYYAGEKAILRALTSALPLGFGLNTPRLIEGEEAPPSGMATWAGSALAGLTAGFNPCALSMLLFFLALLIGANVPVKRYAALYLGAKFISYLLIGTVLIQLFSALNLMLLPLIAKIILTILCVVLAVLNLMDAHAARTEKYGEIKNQLPAPIRRFLHGRIKQAVTKPNRWFSLSVVALGFIVAGGEFMCSGQLYLATLTAQIQAGVDTGRMLLMLTLFSALFILPSVALSILVIRGREVFDVSEWMRERMPLIKVITALVLIAVCIFSWLS